MPRLCTLIHGDASFSDVLQPHDSAEDLSHPIARFWSPEYRRGMERQLLSRYHERLLRNGLEGWGWRELWSGYRLAVILRVLFMPVWFWTAGFPAWRGSLDRTMQAFDELGCREVLVGRTRGRRQTIAVAMQRCPSRQRERKRGGMAAARMGRHLMKKPVAALVLLPLGAMLWSCGMFNKPPVFDNDVGGGIGAAGFATTAASPHTGSCLELTRPSSATAGTTRSRAPTPSTAPVEP